MKPTKPEKGEAQLRLLGVMNFGTFPDATSAYRALFEYGVDAYEAGHPLSSLAVLMNKSDPAAVKVTLARRHYWRSIAPVAVWPPGGLARLNAQDETNSLLLFFAGETRDSHSTVSIDEMLEALN